MHREREKTQRDTQRAREDQLKVVGLGRRGFAIIIQLNFQCTKIKLPTSRHIGMTFLSRAESAFAVRGWSVR